MVLVLTATQQCTLAISVVDKKGNPAAVDGVPAWGTSDASLLTVTPAMDGLSAVIIAVGSLGTAQVNVSADADLGDGVTAITGTLDVTITAAQATAVAISAGTPTEQ